MLAGGRPLFCGIPLTFSQTEVVFHTCILYVHGMMWPSQWLESGLRQSEDSSQAVRAILNIASRKVEEEEVELRSLVFPLLLAGVFAESASEKMRAQNLMQALESESIGHNTRATQELLETVCDRQNRRFMDVGHSLDVDCIEVMRSMGQRTVHLGLETTHRGRPLRSCFSDRPHVPSETQHRCE